MRAFECLAKLNRLNGILCIAEHPVERTCLRYTIGAVELELAELGYCAENEDGLWVLVWTREGSLPSSSDLSTKEREALNVFTLNFAADGLVDFAGEGAFFYHRAKEELMALGYRVEHDDERQPNPLGYGFPYLVKTDGQTR
jgi:hypothetical protein